ncbi:uncharacterized protein ACA1_020670 [Acanthamoeba castellanii str. Neff]|uniref:DUF5900 domain-containing protein n=1 Tax=Acanthamoeba castellanii (strain ATCC 30010 / Neff) TaxID=1257118 RepID=L8GMI9_ACACF|nr:uncharacterized protein ACA1_020670 [Acanthamoeba castellanii str. Neff]ELR14192.1 hypothetical protein ACA1_020670 [Acanthamoeba castellanii str. Neff]
MRARPLSTEPPDVVEETEYTRRRRSTSTPFGGDAYVDTVPRGALLICDPLAAPETAAKWRALKASVIDRFGGALSFALLCKTHPNSIDRKRWPCSDSESLGTVAIDDIGSHVRGQVVKHVGRWTAHGYAIVFCAKQKTTFEGLWERGTMTHGYFRGWSPSSRTFAWLRRPGGKVFGCLWHTTAPDGKSRGHICHYVPASHRDRFARRGPLQYNIDTMPPLCKPDAADGICVCGMTGGDRVYLAHRPDLGQVITRLKIASNNGAWGFDTDIIIEGCEWTVIEPVEDAVYQGRVLYPADPRSRQFDQMAEYVLSGRSEQAFGPDQQAAFVAAIRAVIAARDGAL